jgi:hypothetical protein
MAEWVLIKFMLGNLLKFACKLQFGWNQPIMDTSHEDLHVFQWAEVTGWGICSRPHNHMLNPRGVLHDNIVSKLEGARHPTHAQVIYPR